jgi:hypothetical protein
MREGVGESEEEGLIEEEEGFVCDNVKEGK